MHNAISASELDTYIGQEVGVTDWVKIDQDRINLFAEATGDFQYIHIDPKRAALSPFGTTIAHGYLTLSLLSMLSEMSGVLKLKDVVMGINYGLDKVRFINPVKVGKRIRARFVLLEATEKKPNHFLMKYKVTVEIEGERKPALIAITLSMAVI